MPHHVASALALTYVLVARPPLACRTMRAPPLRAGLFERMSRGGGGEGEEGGAAADAWEEALTGSELSRPSNRFYDAVTNISAPELIGSFAETAPPEVQQAVRSTVVSLLGNLPPQLYDTSVASTGQNVASLMYSMQLTGYMFRNAEYRRSLVESLQRDGGDSAVLPPVDEAGAALPEVSGLIKVKLGEGTEVEVEAAAYMSELRSEVSRRHLGDISVEAMRGELMRTRETTREAQGGGLLAYIQSLGRDNLQSLTSSISQEVLDAMRLLIESILREADVGGDTFMETPGVKLRELLVWQLVTGYRLRELEAREELNRALTGEPE
ncbi:hypothetical protein EMIHUDRAFT_442684 [Emiliania huxleyi CCMP1516]|uniref:Uncharacterized protein n=2 Tax=Emiliania huxleyi TaxID=2903 RepID=A0A0D3K201_EMIH1|nr:hypothetical protein EMIHUDRAFT_442684 [Emiliania huxleyi CCMP1516]EOD29786.1 hypothetical protein EMIHUDRAFT_442684 [Emiliania huxleyi CCMP1516]|eukprot:XP_005782215.1 hypothetical protein EMIHUDRAFT_442684 [Emiliania huxleyi CCMP1516]